jgi:dethiobiotin synthetase
VSVFDELHRPGTPGIFVTATGTEVGKTVAACLIADQLRRREAASSPRSTIGVLKPFGTGCRRDREGLVSPDAEELATAAAFDPDIGGLDLICPIRYTPPVAPVAAMSHRAAPLIGRAPAQRGDWEELDVSPLDRSLRRLDERCSFIVVEGIGGAAVPLAVEPVSSRNNPRLATVLDLMLAIGYPVLVVARADLGTLNETALTCAAIRGAGLTLAGIILNGFDPEESDLAHRTNPRWLSLQNRTSVLATLPAWGAGRPGSPWDPGAIPPALRDAIDGCDFASVCRPGRGPVRRRG